MRARMDPHPPAPYPQSVAVLPRCIITLLAAALLALAIAVVWALGAAPSSGGPPDGVYTVAGLSGQLRAYPTPQGEPVVRVRAVAVLVRRWVQRDPSSGRFLLSRPLLLDPYGRGTLPLRIGPEDRTLGALRRLPVVGALVPPPQTWAWGKPAVYRVQLETVRTATMEAVLLDAGRQDS